MRVRFGATGAFFVACVLSVGALLGVSPCRAQTGPTTIADIPLPGVLPAWTGDVTFANGSAPGSVPNVLGGGIGLPGGGEAEYSAGVGGAAGVWAFEQPIYRNGVAAASVGVYRRSTDDGATGFAIGGYQNGPINLYAGLTRERDTMAIAAGAAYQLTPVLWYTATYQSGPGNGASTGVAYAVSPTTMVNPVLTRDNSTGTTGVGATITVSFDFAKKSPGAARGQVSP